MGRIGDRAALTMFLLLSGGTIMGLGMTSIARSTKKRDTLIRQDGSGDFDARLKSLERK